MVVGSRYAPPPATALTARMISSADPEHSVVLAAVANGTAPDESAYRRFHDLAAALYADLGIRSEFQTR